VEEKAYRARQTYDGMSFMQGGDYDSAFSGFLAVADDIWRYPRGYVRRVAALGENGRMGVVVIGTLLCLPAVLPVGSGSKALGILNCAAYHQQKDMRLRKELISNGKGD
jgi:hypothetical protein